VTPESFNGFDPAAYLPDAPQGAADKSLDDLVAFNRRSAKTHSGIWRDLAVRKRPTEVDAQLGIVVTLSREAATGRRRRSCLGWWSSFTTSKMACERSRSRRSMS
jgi:hypothetical protein